MSSKVATETRKKGAQRVVPSRGLAAQNRFSFPQRVDNAPAAEDRELPATLAEPELGHDFSQISIHPPVPVGDRGATQSVVQSCPLAASPRACPFGGACHTCPARVQTKLADSQPDDPYKREVDRIADFPKGEIIRAGAPLQAALTRLESSGLPIGDGLLQRKCTCGSSKSPLDEKCDECQSPALQRKLTIGASNDPLEREADRIAEEVLAMPTHSAIGSTVPSIQRLSGQPTGQSDAAPVSVDQTLANPGTALESALRQDMERRFGYDFSQVRVHSGAAAEQSARDVSATAYTVGHNIVFGAGWYAPETHQGRLLIAHELTHVVQQSAANGKNVGRSNVKRDLSPNVSQQTLGWGRPERIQGKQLGPDPRAAVATQKAYDMKEQSEPRGTGQRNPDIVERVVIEEAHQRRIVLLEAAFPHLETIIASYRAKNIDALRPYRRALKTLNLFEDALDPRTPKGESSIPYLEEAMACLKGNYSKLIPPHVIDETSKCEISKRGKQWAMAGNPLIICPVFFGGRPECQSFVLMHEVFHLGPGGITGHGQGYDSMPEWALTNPSSLVNFAWLLATGTNPMCDEKSPSLLPWPTHPRGAVV